MCSNDPKDSTPNSGVGLQYWARVGGVASLHRVAGIGRGVLCPDCLPVWALTELLHNDRDPRTAFFLLCPVPICLLSTPGPQIEVINLKLKGKKPDRKPFMGPIV